LRGASDEINANDIQACGFPASKIIYSLNYNALLTPKESFEMTSSGPHHIKEVLLRREHVGAWTFSLFGQKWMTSKKADSQLIPVNGRCFEVFKSQIIVKEYRGQRVEGPVAATANVWRRQRVCDTGDKE
jgi:hypothetical protein